MNKKLLIVSVALALVACFAVGMTLAYLTANTSPVTNTFTVGNVDVALAETTTNYQMIPGREIDKDPIVSVTANSEVSYVFVKIEKSANFDDYMEFEVDDDWTALSGVDGVYYIEHDTKEADSWHVLDEDIVTVKTTVTSEMMADANTTPPTLTFTAYAIQHEGFDTASDAWSALQNQLNP